MSAAGLLSAVKSDDAAAVRREVEAGVPLEVQMPESPTGWTALMRAANSSKVNALNVLIELCKLML